MKHKGLILAMGLLSLFFINTWSTQAYNFTWDELQQINDQKSILKASSNKELWNYYWQLSQWAIILQKNDKLWTASKQLRDYSYSTFSTRKSTAKENTLSKKSDLIKQYKENITLDKEFPNDKCFWRYNTIDNISFANDFPTALTIAVRYRESTCSYYLPSNGDGPFQIVSKDYWTWDIDETTFNQIIQDFIDFSKKKIDRYNEKNANEYPEIKLTYSDFDYNDLWKFAWLYNWLSWSTVYWEIWPATPKYFLEWYENFKDSGRFWLFPAFLKVLEREIENN